MMPEKAQFLFDDQEQCYQVTGDWIIHSLETVQATLSLLPIADKNEITINGKDLKRLDSAGALCLQHCLAYFTSQEKTYTLLHFDKEQLRLLTLIKDKEKTPPSPSPTATSPPFLQRLGKETLSKIDEADGFLVLVGDMSLQLFSSFTNWRRFPFASILSNIDSTGIKALPIVALLSFLIGVVLSYQMGLQLQTYGANIFIAYLSGLAIFREFAPLITAIIVAGRTSSAFTAQIGSMKINEELDAITTMGLSSTKLLVLPKLLGLLIVMPLLIFWADVFSIFGAMYMSKWMLDVGYYDFLVRLKEAVGLKQLLLGLYKAPVFAIVISLVGCYQGLAVQANASSIGSQTTKSVVQALFLIIIVDACFSVMYSWMNV